MSDASELRSQFPTFTYSGYSWDLISDTAEHNNSSLLLQFFYKIGDKHTFTSQVQIHNVTQEQVEKVGKSAIDNYVFHIGLSEMFSYWKTTASPEIQIEAGALTQDQIEFWHALLIKGMGEFFYQNKINFTADDFVTILSAGKKSHQTKRKSPGTQKKQPKILIPVGGGKDSAVTLELLKENFSVGTYTVSAPEAAHDIIRASRVFAGDQIRIGRTLDPHLFELNKQGYLNGHVPISAFLAFLSILTADLFGYSHVAISNERSSNEGNTWYCDQEINHQYSKTYEFEHALQNYVTKHLPENSPFYFSFLRPLYELQIAQIFATLPQYHTTFRSCNRGQKENVWCGECSKCLFAWTILFPFIEVDKLAKFFGKNLFADASLWLIAQDLLGISRTKPFECVGTHEETIAAFFLSIQPYIKSNIELPPLLEKVHAELQNNPQLLSCPESEDDYSQRANSILTAWNTENSLPEEFSAILQSALKKSQKKA